MVDEMKLAKRMFSHDLSKGSVLSGVAQTLYNHMGALSLAYDAGSLLKGWLTSHGKSKTRRRMRVAVTNKDNGKMTMQAIPSAIATVIDNPTYWREERLQGTTDVEEGVRIIGRQYYSVAGTGVADYSPFNGGSTLSVSPDVIGGRLALIARTYSRYAFRHFRLMFVTAVATTQVGSISVAYIQDAVAASFASLSFQSIMQMEPSVLTPARVSAKIDMNYGGPAEFYTEYDSTSDASKRLTVQGAFYAQTDQVLNLTLGHWIIEYVCDLHQPSWDFGFTINVKLTKSERDLLLEYLTGLRQAKGNLAGKLSSSK